jgi:4-amino-4-deoxy-L-arabinose transferase-like glycosyltransferase
VINPDIALAFFVPLTIVYVVECAWRLSRRRPANYGSVFAETLLPFTMFLIMITLQTPNTPLRVSAKGFIVAGNVAAMILRLVTRKRFAVQM